MRLLIVGNPEPIHVGAHFLAAARRIGVDATCADTREAFAGPAWRQKADWWLRGHRPASLQAFASRCVRVVRETQPDVVIATGLAPLDAAAIRDVQAAGAVCVNFLTDDPWNPAHRAPWFMDALPQYDVVFSPRRANLADLEACGVGHVRHLPFGYNPDVHFPECPTPESRGRFAADVMLAGGADSDRVGLLTPLLATPDIDVALYGGYWSRHPATRAAARGHIGPAELRLAVAHARVCLGFVRRANRDGHAMRTYEVAAMGGCLLIEDTDDHRALFGADGECVTYFSQPDELRRLVRRLLDAPHESARLAQAVRRRITGGAHTYADRLETMLGVVAEVDPRALAGQGAGNG